MMTTTNQNVIDPVPVEFLEMELTPDRLLRDTNKGGNKIYIIDAFSAPNVMREVGRLREIAFRAAGGGTGKDCDIDEFDTMEPPCRQLVVWDPEAREIIGGYRFIPGNEIKMRSDGMPRIATSHMFSFSERFLKDYLPHTIELGRSFVRLEYQTTRVGVKALYALDNLLGRSRRADGNISRHALSLWKGDHVSELQCRLPQHDSVFPYKTLP